MIVVDASLAAAWLLHESAAVPTEALLDILASEQILVPPHWATEVGNALRRAVRMKRIHESEIDLMVERLSLLDVTTAAPLAVSDIAALTHFALEQGLSVYDAAYLRLAADSRVPLATIDQNLRGAAQRLNVPLLPA